MGGVTTPHNFMLKKDDAKRIKELLNVLMKSDVSLKRMVNCVKDIEWLAKVALDLEKPDLQIINKEPIKTSKKKRSN